MGAMKANRKGRELLALHRVLETLVAALLKYLRALVLAVQAALAGHLTPVSYTHLTLPTSDLV